MKIQHIIILVTLFTAIQGNLYSLETNNLTTFKSRNMTKKTNKIAFLRGNLYIVDENGKNYTQLTEYKSGIENYEWSSDNSKILYQISLSRYNGIYVLDLKSEKIQVLSEKNGINPKWSPDGTKIVFLGGEDNYQIYVINADGSNQRQLTAIDDPRVIREDTEPNWSPDGKKILFSKNARQSLVKDDDYGGVYIMDANGENQINLYNNEKDLIECKRPRWSPDGTKIAFLKASSLYVMNADGSNPINITNNISDIGNFCWAPDSNRIAFEKMMPVTNNKQNNDIFVINSDGTNMINLTKNILDDTNPSWSSNSNKIAYTTSNDGYFHEISIVNADGSNTKKLLSICPSCNIGMGAYMPKWNY